MCVRCMLAVFLWSVVPRGGAGADVQAIKKMSLMRRDQPIAQLQKGDESQTQEELSKTVQVVSEFDAGKDGKLSLTETANAESGDRNKYQEQSRTDFKALDSNGDGLLNNTEVENIDKYLASYREVETQGRNLVTSFKEADADHDGRLSLEDISAEPDLHVSADSRDRLKTLFNASDSNHDGFLEAAEFLASPQFIDATQNDQGEGAEDEDVADGETERPADSEFLTDLDTDRDGKVSLAEILARQAANYAGADFTDTYKWHFERADGNQDSLLDLGEFSKLLDRLEATDSQHEDARDPRRSMK